MCRLLNQICTLYNIFNLSINITLYPFEITNNIDPSDRFLYEETFLISLSVYTARFSVVPEAI